MLIQSEVFYKHWQNRLGSTASRKRVWEEEVKTKKSTRSEATSVVFSADVTVYLASGLRSLRKIPPVHLPSCTVREKSPRATPFSRSPQADLSKKKLFWKDVEGRRDAKRTWSRRSFDQKYKHLHHSLSRFQDLQTIISRLVWLVGKLVQSSTWHFCSHDLTLWSNHKAAVWGVLWPQMPTQILK